MMYKNKQFGFSLVETLVAISLLLLIVASQMSVSNATKGSSYAREQTQAFFLAQEGIELVQNVRDGLFLEHLAGVFDGSGVRENPWADFTSTTNSPIKDCFSSTVGCGLSFDSAGTNGEIKVVACSGSNCLLYLNDDLVNKPRSIYNHDNSNPKTLFSRKIYIDDSNEAFIKVRSEVTWRTGTLIAGQKVVVDTYLYNTYDYD